MSLHDVAIEGHVKGLVLGDPAQRRSQRRLLFAARTSRAEVEGPGRGLLDGRVDHPFEWSGQGVAPAGRDHRLSRTRPGTVIPAVREQ